jgi:hypothetical protein
VLREDLEKLSLTKSEIKHLKLVLLRKDKMTKTFRFMGLLMVLALLLSACQPAATPTAAPTEPPAAATEAPPAEANSGAVSGRSGYAQRYKRPGFQPACMMR